MPFSTRHLSDSAPRLAPLDGLSVNRETDAAWLGALQSKTPDEMEARLGAGHRAYVARLHGEPAAWGWVATRTARIGEVGAEFRVPQGERYLWNFVTLRGFRGMGIYPRLLDGIVRAEAGEAERFWVGHAPENRASEAGIRKAGFNTVADLALDSAGKPPSVSASRVGARWSRACSACRSLRATTGLLALRSAALDGTLELLVRALLLRLPESRGRLRGLRAGGTC